MNKKLVVIGLLYAVSLYFFVPIKVHALDLGTGLAGTIATNAGYAKNTTQTTLSETLGTVVKVALSLVGVIFMSLMVYAGYLWMTARGDDSKIEKSQDIIRSSVIGLIITVGAYSITAFVLPRILAKTTGSSGGASTVGSPVSGGRCAWDSGSRTNIINEPTCFTICNPIGRSAIGCVYDGVTTDGDPECHWSGGSMSGTTGGEAACFDQCAPVGRRAINCVYTP